MRLTEELTGYVNAAFTGIWINTFEPDEAEREIVQHAIRHKWKIAAWDIANGMRLLGEKIIQTAVGSDPVAVVRALPALAQEQNPTPDGEKRTAPDQEKGTALLLL